MNTITHTTDRLEGRGAMRSTWKRLGAVGLSLAAVAAAVTTTALAQTAGNRALSSQDLNVVGGTEPVQSITGISCAGLGCDLWATSGTLSLPDGSSHTIWGYGLAPGAATVPGPTIVATKGDTLTVHLHNDLPVATSLSLAALPVAAADPETLIAPAGTDDYTFTVGSSGTLTYEPGPGSPTGNRQVAVGLAGVVVVRPNAAANCPTSAQILGCAYGDDRAGTLDNFNAEALIAINDLDSAMLATLNTPSPLAYGMQDFSPDIHLINGKAFPQGDVIDALAGDSVLLRYANLSPIDRTMGVLGAQQQIIGRDAHPLLHTNVAVAPLFTPGQTAEVVVKVSTNAQPGDRFAVADQSRRMTRINTGGSDLEITGALTFINVWKAGGDPNQPVPTNLALTSGTIDPGSDVSSGLLPLTFSFTDSVGTQWRYFIDQIGGPFTGPATPALGVVNTTVLANGPHVIWVQSRTSASAPWGDASGLSFFLDRSGPVVRNTTAGPDALNGDPDHNTITISATGDTSLTGTQDVIAATYGLTVSPIVTCAPVLPFPMTVDPGSTPMPQVKGFTATNNVTALLEGKYNVSVIAQDTLLHYSSNASGVTPICETTSFVVDKTGPVTGVAGSADPAVTNGNNGYVANPSWQDSVYVQVQLTDLPSNGVNSNIARIEGFLEGSDGRPDPVTGVNVPYTWTLVAGYWQPSFSAVPVNVDGSGFEFVAKDGAFDSPTETAYMLVPLSTIRFLTTGAHRVFVQALDSAGNWGPGSTPAVPSTTPSALQVGATITFTP